jgi:hypothetical protein
MDLGQNVGLILPLDIEALADVTWDFDTQHKPWHGTPLPERYSLPILGINRHVLA